MPPQLPEFVTSDIVAHVQKALGRFGTPGTLRFEQGHLILADGAVGAPLVTPIGGWANDWTRMDEGSRRLRAEEAARALSQQRSMRPASLGPRRRIFIDAKWIALGLLLLGSLAWTFWGAEELPGSRSSSDDDPVEDPLDGSAARAKDAVGPSSGGDARASRVCSATLTRVFQGGSVSVADVDGFRVEIALLKTDAATPLHTHAALARFVENPNSPTGSRFTWKEEEGLAAVTTSDSVVVVRDLRIGQAPESPQGVVLSFGGSLVDAYFKEDERNRYFHIASALSTELGATHAAVYARCFDQPLHALGSWFRGLDTGGAVTALVYFMGTYARPIHLAKPFTRLPGEEGLNRPYALQSIVDKTKGITRTDLATLLGQDGGMATGRDGDQVLILFPFGDGNRASRASRNIVRISGLGL